jgi:hypothetical protein
MSGSPAFGLKAFPQRPVCRALTRILVLLMVLCGWPWQEPGNGYPADRRLTRLRYPSGDTIDWIKHRGAVREGG